MKTDKFDKAFRRKVENFHPPFSEDEIDRVQGYVNQLIPLSLWQRFGHIFTYSVGSLMILTLLTTTIFQANENKSLLNKISELNKQLKQQPTQTAVNGSSLPIIVQKIDTVYVVKHIKHKITIDDYEEDIATQPRINRIENASFENGSDISENMDISSNIKTEKSISNLNKEEIAKEDFRNGNNENRINTNIKGTNAKKQSETITQQNGFVNKKSGSNSNSQSASEKFEDKKETYTSQIANNQPINNFQSSLNQTDLKGISSKIIVLKDLKSRGYNPLGLSPAISFADRQFKTERWVDSSPKKVWFQNATNQFAIAEISSRFR